MYRPSHVRADSSASPRTTRPPGRFVGDTVILSVLNPEAHHHAARRVRRSRHIAAGAAQELAASRLLRRRAGPGTTTCTVQAAATAARAGFRTLCIDGSRGAQGSARPAPRTLVSGWRPCRLHRLLHRRRFRFVGVDASDGRRQLFNNLAAARASGLLSDFSEYDFIMMDLAPMLEGREDSSINPLAAATICEEPPS